MMYLFCRGSIVSLLIFSSLCPKNSHFGVPVILYDVSFLQSHYSLIVNFQLFVPMKQPFWCTGNNVIDYAMISFTNFMQRLYSFHPQCTFQLKWVHSLIEYLLPSANQKNLSLRPQLAACFDVQTGKSQSTSTCPQCY